MCSLFEVLNLLRIVVVKGIRIRDEIKSSMEM